MARRAMRGHSRILHETVTEKLEAATAPTAPMAQERREKRRGTCSKDTGKEYPRIVEDASLPSPSFSCPFYGSLFSLSSSSSTLFPGCKYALLCPIRTYSSQRESSSTSATPAGIHWNAFFDILDELKLAEVIEKSHIVKRNACILQRICNTYWYSTLFKFCRKTANINKIACKWRIMIWEIPSPRCTTLIIISRYVEFRFIVSIFKTILPKSHLIMRLVIIRVIVRDLINFTFLSFIARILHAFQDIISVRVISGIRIIIPTLHTHFISFITCILYRFYRLSKGLMHNKMKILQWVQIDLQESTLISSSASPSSDIINCTRSKLTSPLSVKKPWK
ncbi:hypothetical protein ALC53_03883 [Atta colombica]|uniref:Uncharacterized protein n=1 Tax=Atta colombica TaxID=520822 RepID=A0A195BND9_9HYME|nr:hypothetical protein ALC53_03883 [Atta colombica]